MPLLIRMQLHADVGCLCLLMFSPESNCDVILPVADSLHGFPWVGS